jgi:hypothetical protein
MPTSVHSIRIKCLLVHAQHGAAESPCLFIHIIDKDTDGIIFRYLVGKVVSLQLRPDSWQSTIGLILLSLDKICWNEVMVNPVSEHCGQTTLNMHVSNTDADST